jgi:hypothetical protein
MKIKKFLTLVMLVLGASSSINRAEAIEEAKYEVLINERDFELRQYKAHIVAETTVEGDFSEVGNEGFRRLFRFISGENLRRQTIAMTAPVDQKESSEKIKMTAPVNQQKDAGVWIVSFLMPSSYTLETIPQPVDERIHIREVPSRLVAAVRYSGTWSRTRFEKEKARLEGFILKHNLKSTGEAIFARYNPPFTLWFLRRNEVLIPVERHET